MSPENKKAILDLPYNRNIYIYPVILVLFYLKLGNYSMKPTKDIMLPWQTKTLKVVSA